MPYYCTVINNIHGFQWSEWIRTYSLGVLFAAYFVAVFVFWTCCLLTMINYNAASFSFMRHRCSHTEYKSLSSTYWGTKLWTHSWKPLENLHEAHDSQKETSVFTWSASYLRKMTAVNCCFICMDQCPLLFYCAWRIPPWLQTHGARNVFLPKDKLVELYSRYEKTCFLVVCSHFSVALKTGQVMFLCLCYMVIWLVIIFQFRTRTLDEN